MRDILFRGKSMNGIGWIEGSLRITTIQPADDDPYKQYEIEDTTCGVFPNDFMCGICETVDSETIGQFTGLTDKNGKKIFEGDILGSRYDDLYPDNETIEVVKWFRNGWAIQQGKYLPAMLDEDGVLPYSEVIGNIHDNPDLLIRQGGQK